MGPDEPYWQTNSSFSPPPSRWEFGYETDRLQDGSNDLIQRHISSTSRNIKESRNWMRAGVFPDYQYSTSDAAGLYYSSPSDVSPAPRWIPPERQGFDIDDYKGISARRDSFSGPYCTPTMEGASSVLDSGVSTSSQSDGSDETTVKMHLFSNCNVLSRRSFMSKPIHPLSFPTQMISREVSDTPVAGLPEVEVPSVQRNSQCWSTASSSMDYTDVSEPLEPELSGPSGQSSEASKCGLCERYLSQRSPWSSHRIVRSGDMPIAGVLPCSHVYHAECLDQTTPKAHTSDPPCPLCIKSDANITLELHPFSRLKSGAPRPRPFCEDASARPWTCAQAGDCVEGAFHTSSRNTVLALNRTRLKKNLSLKGSSSKDFPGLKVTIAGSCGLPVSAGRMFSHQQL